MGMLLKHIIVLILIFITSKVTYDIAYSKAKAGYVICENLLSDLLGLLF